MRGALLATVLMLGSGSVLAEETNAYWGLMGGVSKYKDTTADIGASTLTGRLGYILTDFLSFEVRGGMSNSGRDDISGIKLRVAGYASAFIKFDWSPGKQTDVNIYLLGGYTGAALEAENPVGVSTTKSGPSAGIGLELFADANRGLQLEWVRYLDTTIWGADASLDHVGLGYIERF